MTEMVGSFGRNDSGPFSRNCVFTNSQQSSAPCAGCAIAMLIIPIRDESGCGCCLQRNLAQKRGNHGRKI
jgi:hypothetical protein